MPNLHEIVVSLTAKSTGFDQGINQAMAATKRLDAAIKQLQTTISRTPTHLPLPTSSSSLPGLKTPVDMALTKAPSDPMALESGLLKAQLSAKRLEAELAGLQRRMSEPGAGKSATAMNALETSFSKAQGSAKRLETQLVSLHRRMGEAGAAKSPAMDAGFAKTQGEAKRLEAELARLKQQQGSLGAVTASTASAVTKSSTAMTQSVAAANPLVGHLKSLVLGYVAVQAAINATKFAVTAASTLETQERAWKAITGSAKQAATELNFLRTTADKTGVGFNALEKGYRQIAAASKDTVMEGKATKDIFLAITEAGSRLGLSSDDVTGALRAISQMLSTGTIQADEFKNELGNRLPGIMAIGAKSIGVTTKEFMKLMEQGKLLPEEVIPKLAIGIREKFVPALAAGTEEAKTLGQEFARAGNVIALIAASLAKDTGLTDWLKRIAKGVGDMGKAVDFELSRQKMRMADATDAVAIRIRPLEDMREAQGLGPLSPSQLQQTGQELAKIDSQLNGLFDRLGAMKPNPNKLDEFMEFGAREKLHKDIAALEVQRALILSNAATRQSGAMRNLPTPSFGGTWGTEAPRDLSAATGELTALQEYNKEFADIQKRTEDYRRSLHGVAEEWEIVKKTAEFYDKAVQKLQEDSAKLMKLQGRAPLAVQSLIQESSARHGQDPRLIEAIMKAESGFDPRAVSRTGNKGLMQLGDATASDMNVKDPFNIQQNIEGGARYWAQIQAKYPGNLDRQLAAWNYGPNRQNVQNWQGVQALPKETQEFIPRVKANFAAIQGGTSMATPPTTFRTDLEDEFQSGERRHAISLLNVKVDQERVEGLEKLLKSLDPVTTATDEQYRTLELLRASSLGATGETDAMGVALQNVEDNLKLSNVRLNERERAMAAQTIQAESALMTDQKAAEVIRVKLAAHMQESKAIEDHTKVLRDKEKVLRDVELAQKAVTEAEKDFANILREMDTERFTTIADIIAQMKEGLPTIKEYEKALKRLRELGARPATLAIAKSLEIQSTAAFKAIKQGAEDLANFLQSTILSQMTPFTGGEAEDFTSQISTADERVSRLEERRDRLSEQLFERPDDKQLLEQLRRTDEAIVKAKDHLKEFEDASISAAEKAASPWRKFADTVVQEFARIIMEATEFRKEMAKLLTQAGTALLKLIGNIGGSAAAGGATATGGGGGGGDITQGGFGQYNMAEGGFLGARQSALTGEAGRELMFSGGRMRLMGLHGPEVVRSRESAFVIPHKETMTILRGQRELDNMTLPTTRRAMGGPVNAGQEFLAGEIGRELVLSGVQMRLVGLHGPEVVKAQKQAFVIPHEETMTLLRKPREIDNVVQTMARREMGGPVSAGQMFLAGEAGVEGVVSRSERHQGGVNITVNVQGVKDMQSFVQPRSQAEIQRAMATALRAAQRSM